MDFFPWRGTDEFEVHAMTERDQIICCSQFRVFPAENGFNSRLLAELNCKSMQIGSADQKVIQCCRSFLVQRAATQR